MKYLISVMSLVLVITSVSAAETEIVVGTHQLLPDTPNQVIALFANGDDQVRGFNLRAEIGDDLGVANSPIFSAISFANGIWGPDVTVIGGPVVDDERFAQSSVAITDEFATVESNGLIANLAVSTLGIHDGTFALSLTGTAIGQDSDFVTVGGGTFVPNISNGSIRIVPEPDNFLLPFWTFVTGLLFHRNRMMGVALRPGQRPSNLPSPAQRAQRAGSANNNRHDGPTAQPFVSKLSGLWPLNTRRSASSQPDEPVGLG